MADAQFPGNAAIADIISQTGQDQTYEERGSMDDAKSASGISRDAQSMSQSDGYQEDAEMQQE
jgi:hypothetical protein